MTERLLGIPARASAAEADALEPTQSVDVVQAGGGSGLASVSEQIYAYFHPVPTLRLLAVLIHYTGQGLDLPAPNGLDFAATLELLLKTYPMGRLEFANCIEHEFDGDLSLPDPGTGCGPGWGQLRDLLVRLAANSDDGALPVGLVPLGVRNPFVYGCGWSGQAAAVFDGDLNNMAQEVGHAFGLTHAPACLAPDPDPHYPIYDNYPSGSIGEFGFDVSTSEVKDPATWTDFMGYCRSRWVSPYTYNNVRSGMSDFFNQQFRSVLEEDRLRELLFLNFRLHRDGRVEVRPSFHLPKARDRVELGAPSDICCELLDRDGEVLVFHRCRSQLGEDPDGPYRDFNEAFRWASEAASIRFLQGREVLNVHQIEEVVPEVEFRPYQLKGEEPMQLEWAGRHPENDLRYSIRYSNDGGETWTAVAANLREPRCRMNPLWLPGGDACLLQVVASSGIRTSLASGDVFQMPLKRRRAYILSPRPRTKVEEGGQVVFRGGGFSSDFGLGDMEDIIWSSDLDGTLGRGFELAAEIRSAGLHTITLTVPDGVDGVSTARTSLRATARD